MTFSAAKEPEHEKLKECGSANREMQSASGSKPNTTPHELKECGSADREMQSASGNKPNTTPHE